MFIDDTLVMCDETDIANNTGFTLIGSAKSIRPRAGDANPDNATLDISSGEPIYVVIEVDTAFATENITEYELALFTHTASTGVTGGVQLNSIRFVTGQFTAGRRFVFTLPKPQPGADAYEEFLGVGGRKTGATTSGTASGKITAFLTKDVDNWFGTATRVEPADPAN